jgi:hypothetical protein
MLQEAAPVCGGGCRPSAYVLFEKLPCSLVGFGGSSTSFSGGERLSLIGKPDAALDLGEADAKETGGLGLGHPALLNGLNYLAA